MNFNQKNHRMGFIQELLNANNSEANDETWVYGYDVETKIQSPAWKLLNEPRPKKAR